MQEEILKYFPFKTPRKGQIELIEKIIKLFKSGKKHIILNAPTGWGKSVIAYTIMKYFGSGFILTSQKCLQEQYYNDLKIPFVLGRANYQCSKNNLLTCEFGMCKNIPNNYCNNCQYLKARDNALSSLISDLNYNYYLTYNINKAYYDENNNKILGVPYRKILVCDECHNLESELINICSLKLSEKLLKYLGILVQMPLEISDDEDKFAWLFNKVLPKMQQQQIYFSNQIHTYKAFKISKEYKQTVIKFSTIKRLISSINEIKKQKENNSKVIINYDNNILEFKLLFANNLFNQYIEQNADYILHMSATILSKNEYCSCFSLNPNEVEYIQVDSFFPIENRLIYVDPVGSLSYAKKFETMPKLINKVSDLLKQYNNVKGIIHTANYNIAEILLDNLVDNENGWRLLMPRGDNRQIILDKFYNSTEPYVLISPSLTEGLDLKDDLSRFCIICKVPYANITDAWTKARMNLNNNWYINNTAQILIQMTGRSIRSETDYSTTYILDSDFINFAQRAINIFPKWWKDSVKLITN